MSNEKELTKEELKDIKTIRGEVKDFDKEVKIIPIVKNKYNVQGKEIKQYKLNIPKNFANFLEFDSKEFIAKSTLDKENKKIIIEIKQK